MLDRGWGTAVLVASGSSLTDEQVAIARAARAAGKCHAIVINDNWRKWPDADVLYACDDLWWKEHHAAVAAGFTGERWTQNLKAARAYSLQYIKAVRSPGLTTNRDTIHVGGPGGCQASNLAYLFGSRRQILIGFDCKRGARSREHPTGTPHWFGKHPRKLTQGEPLSWVPAFNALAKDAAARGVEILNASLDTALECFPRVNLAEALNE